jgi:hypothetical protein
MARHAGVGIESTYGTPVAPTDFFEATTESLATVRNFEDLNTIRSNSVLRVEELNSLIQGDMEMLGNYQDLGLLLKLFFGSNDVSGVGPYTHTFPAAAGTSGRAGISGTIEIQRDSTALTWRYAGCKITSLGLSVSLDSSPKVTVGVQAKSEATGTAETPTFPTFDPMLVGDVTVNLDATALDATTFNINAEWPVDQPYKLGSSTFAVEPIDSGPLAVTGDFSVYVPDLTEYAKFDGSTAVDVQLAVTDGAHSLTLNMNTCRLTAVSANLSGRDRLLATYEFRSYYDAVATENIQAILVNDDVTIP